MKKKIPRAKQATYFYALSLVVGFCTLLLAIWLGVRFLGNKKITRTIPVELPSIVEPGAIYPPCEFMRLLDGACVQTAEEKNPALIGVMIENARDAWPLRGLSSASVVYEAPVESDIPRFFALYPVATEVLAVGPVRSARPYFVSWAKEYPGSVYAHVGGSPEALQLLENTDELIDLNEMTRGWYFWRDEERSMPHNTYISSKLWQKAAQTYEAEAPKEIGFVFERREPCQKRCTKEIFIDWGASVYDVTWKYVTSSGKYVRVQGSGREAHHPEADLEAGTVIIQTVPVAVLDAVGRKGISTVGTGRAEIFAFGERIVGTWRKEAEGEPTVFEDAGGKIISLAPGPVWVEAVSSRVTVTSSISGE